LQFGEQSARHSFADKDEPHRAGLKCTIIPIGGRREKEGFRAEQFALQEDLY
jgi:hypothetical protein